MFRYIFILMLVASCETSSRKQSSLSSESLRPSHVEIYNLEGKADTVDQRRLQAYARIKEKCKPDAFQILGETRHDPTQPREKPMGTAETQSLAYVEYRCFPKK